MENGIKIIQNSWGGGKHLIARSLEIFSMSMCAHAISAQATVGKGTIFVHHGLGIVVHQDAVIGENCRVFQNVTIGDKLSVKNVEHGVPSIGNNVIIGAGAVLLGNIHIGDNVVIGANAVVIDSIPDGSVAVGVPAKVINL